MKKVKKIFAILMTLAMVMGLSMTAMAATNDTATITVKGLVKEATNIEVYEVVKADANANNWIVCEGAQDYVTITSNPFGIDWKGLKENKANLSKVDTGSTESGEWTSKALPLGAYLIVATTAAEDSVTVYNAMGTTNFKYDESTNLMVGNDVAIYAKSSNIPVDKSSNDNFIEKGQIVTFTVTTTFPSFTDEEMNFLPKPSYKLYDYPSGLDIKSVKSVKIGTTINDTDISGDYDDTIEGNPYVIDLSKYIDKDNFGQTVEVTYTAEVTSATGYSNTANFYKNDTKIGEGTDTGYTAILKVTKLGEGGKTLSGAVFNVYAGENKEGTLLYFTGSNGVYELADSTTLGATTDITTVAGGTVQVKGLAEGKYFFDEKEAPEGYSINTDGVKFEITEDDVEEAIEAEENIELNDTLTDTKLASLPSTGGIGTTIFTIGGCAIMVTAAGLYFATRKKTEK